MKTHIFFGFGGLGLQVPALQVAIFAYFDYYLVRFFILKEIRSIKNIGYYEISNLPHKCLLIIPINNKLIVYLSLLFNVVL